MDQQTARELIALNNAFYRTHAASFSATRQAGWSGWQRVIDTLQQSGALSDGALLLDLACGNLRFERCLEQSGSARNLVVYAADSCPQLIAPTEPGAMRCTVRYREADILKELLAGRDPLEGIPPCDCAVCFGFMHHVPGDALKRAVLETMIDHTRPGGMIALSLWQFMDDDRLAAKAAHADATAASTHGLDRSRLDAGDHFLGWQDDPTALRYCHHFSETEVDELSAFARTAGAHEVARFSDDGRSRSLNRYLILERR